MGEMSGWFADGLHSGEGGREGGLLLVRRHCGRLGGSFPLRNEMGGREEGGGRARAQVDGG